MRLLKLCSLLLLTVTALHTQAASVWKVSSGQNTLYIGGTIHVMTPEDYPLPKEYDSAFQAADKLVFETDIAAINSIEFQQKLMAQLVYADGTTLDKVLKADTYAALKEHLAKRNVPVETMAQLKPALVAISLTVMELQAMGFTSEGVDQFYSNKARDEGKPQIWLETPEEQLAFIVGLGKEDESAMIDYAIKDVEKLPDVINTMHASWLAGDMPALAAATIDDFKANYPQMYQDLLISRNNLWMPQISKMFNDKEVEFILVGAMHLAGPDSILSKLATQGYKIEKL
ncbi:TraB/GumN family protein [Paraglaciecola sp.]|uniref:TraB/GumN family protein n=1 Tax=Paraglaciecola sp. TaxID=1920173 RepID=UPI0030F45F21